MKISRIFGLFVVAFVIAGCGEPEPPAPAEETEVDDSAAVEETTDETVAAEEEAAEEVLEVVEESAAEPEETGDEPILLAPAEDATASVAPPSWQFREGQHFSRLVPTQPTLGSADKIEVAEFFWYGCAHCYSLEATINAWDRQKPANVRFVRIPGMWNNLLRIHAQLYYTEEVLGRNGVIKDPEGFRAAVFEEIHRRGNRLASEDAIMRFFARFGVNEAEFTKIWGSFEVAQKMRIAQDLATRYGIPHVPMVVVNGKFKTDVTDAGGMPQLMNVIDELVARESVR